MSTMMVSSTELTAFESFTELTILVSSTELTTLVSSTELGTIVGSALALPLGMECERISSTFETKLEDNSELAFVLLTGVVNASATGAENASFPLWNRRAPDSQDQ